MTIQEFNKFFQNDEDRKQYLFDLKLKGGGSLSVLQLQQEL